MHLKVANGIHMCTHMGYQFLLFHLIENLIIFFPKYILFPCSIRILAHVGTLGKQVGLERDLDGLCIAKQNFQ